MRLTKFEKLLIRIIFSILSAIGTIFAYSGLVIIISSSVLIPGYVFYIYAIVLFPLIFIISTINITTELNKLFYIKFKITERKQYVTVRHIKLWWLFIPKIWAPFKTNKQIFNSEIRFISLSSAHQAIDNYKEEIKQYKFEFFKRNEKPWKNITYK